MWNVGGNEGPSKEADGKPDGETAGLSQGIGLALLSKALGLNSLEGKFQVHLNRLRKTKLIGNLDTRQKV